MSAAPGFFDGITPRETIPTPLAFRDVLLSLARSVSKEPAQ